MHDERIDKMACHSNVNVMLLVQSYTTDSSLYRLNKYILFKYMSLSELSGEYLRGLKSVIHIQRHNAKSL